MKCLPKRVVSSSGFLVLLLFCVTWCGCALTQADVDRLDAISAGVGDLAGIVDGHTDMLKEGGANTKSVAAAVGDLAGVVKDNAKLLGENEKQGAKIAAAVEESATALGNSNGNTEDLITYGVMAVATILLGPKAGKLVAGAARLGAGAILNSARKK